MKFFLLFYLQVSQKSRNFAVVIQLQRHIEVLLLENECVIVPDFGGFMTHHVSARYDQEDYMFIPPFRTLGFNPQLRLNDSVLVQSYVEAYDISYPEALRRVESEVEELKQQLSERGSYELEDLGTMTVNQDGNYEFAPCEAGVLSPSLYGLGDFSIRPLKDQTVVLPVSQLKVDDNSTMVANEVALEPALLDYVDDTDKEEKTITIKLSWIRNAVAVAAAVVAFFLIATPITNSELGTQTMSQLQHNVLYKLIPQDTNVVPVESVGVNAEASEVSGKSVVADNSVTSKKQVPVQPEAAAPEAPHYVIVVASQVKRSNAEHFIEQLHEQGYKDARIYECKGVIRVVCGRFDTEAEAYRQVNKMNTKEEFYEAWVLKIKC